MAKRLDQSAVKELVIYEGEREREHGSLTSL